MFTPKKSKLSNQRTLNSFFPTLEAANTDDTLIVVDTDNQKKHCDFRLRKTREEMVNTEATSSTTTSQLPSKEDAISLEKGREEISTVFSDIFLYYGKCTPVTLG